MKLSKQNDLLSQANTLNQTLEKSFLALGVVLHEIKENETYKDAGFEDWVEYYRDGLGREKSTVSRLLEVGKWLKDNQMLPPDNIGYRRLQLAIKTYPDKDPNFVVSAAKTLSNSDLYKEKTENEYGANHTHTPKDDRRYFKCECGFYAEDTHK